MATTSCLAHNNDKWNRVDGYEDSDEEKERERAEAKAYNDRLPEEDQKKSTAAFTEACGPARSRGPAAPPRRSQLGRARPRGPRSPIARRRGGARSRTRAVPAAPPRRSRT